MTNQDNRSKNAADLRQKAEALAREQAALTPEDSAALSPGEIRKTLHELRVHQIELEMQNEELRTAQARIEAGRARYFDLYDLAPVGYCTLSEQGLILEANLTAATLLGTARSALIKQPISRFIFKEDQDIYYLHRKKLFETGEPQECELRLVKPDGALFWAHLTATTAQVEDGAPVCRVVLSDITERKQAEAVLERYKNIVSSTTDAIAYLDKNYRYILANNAYEDFSGVSRDDFVGMTVAEYLGKEIFEEKIKPNLDKCLNGEIVNYQEWFEYLTKGKRFVDVTYFPYRDGENYISGVIANTRDITELKQAEKYLERVRYSIDNLTESVFWVGEDGFFIDFNNTSCKRLGYSRAELLKMHVSDLDPLFPQERWQVHWEEIKSRGIMMFETVHRAKNGRLIPMELVVHHQQYGDSRYNCVLGRDITARRQAEEALKASEMRFKELLLNVPTVAVQGYAPDGTMSYWNHASETFYGYTAEEALARNLLDLIIPPAMRDGVRAAIRRMVETGEAIPASEVELMRKDGSLIPVYSSHALVQLPGQEPELFCIDIDLTELKQADAEREKLREQLFQSQKMESVGRLAGGVAHDFNNMLGVILGNVELALGSIGPDDSLRADLEEIRKAAQRSTNLTRQLLAFARKQTIVPRVLDLSDTVAGLLNMLRRLIGEDITLDWKPGRGLWPVKIDPTQIDQILANLCINARDAIAGAGRITVETRNTALDAEYCARQAGITPGEYVTLTVSDDGCGMDSNTLLLVFEPFFTTKEMGKGTGLGLATVYGIVQQNNGFINVYSEPGQGTTFRIYLPRHAAKVPLETEESRLQAVARGSETILLVEDEPAILKMTKRMLERQGYTVLAADSPGEAIRLARENACRIDLLLTDVVMPEMNGRNLAMNLLSICPSLKRLFMSGYTADVIAHHGVLDAGEHFIQKPFSLKDLGAKLREVLGG